MININKNFIIRYINDEIILINKKENNEIYKFNNTSQFIFSLIQKNIDKDTIIKKMHKKYNITESIAEKDVTEFINSLKEVGIIENDNE